MTAPAHVERKAFTVPNLAARWECSEGLIRKMIERKELRSFRLGALIRVPADEVERIECQSLTQSSGSEENSPSSSTTEEKDDAGSCMPKIGRARRPRPDVSGLRATIHRGPWEGS